MLRRACARPSIVAGQLLALICVLATSDLFSQVGPQSALTGQPFDHVVAAGETLETLAARHGVDAGVLAAANNLQPKQRLSPGDSISVNNVHIIPQVTSDGVVINIPQRMLFYFQGGQLVARYPIGVGRPGWVTPHGQRKVIKKEENPSWEIPKSIQDEMRRQGKPVKTSIGPSPDNPLGKYWIGLDEPGIGIHGTNAPASVYQFGSHGCIRLHPDDIAALFQRIQIGTPVTMIYEPVLLARIDDAVYLEVHRDIYKWRGDPMKAARTLAATAQVESKIDWNHAATAARATADTLIIAASRSNLFTSVQRSSPFPHDEFNAEL